MRFLKAPAVLVTTIVMLIQPGIAEAKSGHSDDSRSAIAVGEVASDPYLESYFQEFDIAEQDRRKITEKIAAGDLPDASNPEKRPVAVTTRDIDGVRVTVEEFADGSVAGAEISIPEDPAAHSGSVAVPAKVSQCRHKKGGAHAAYWSNCRARVITPFITMSFNFNYESVRSKGSRITRYSNPSYRSFGNSLRGVKFARQSKSKVRLTGTSSINFNGVTISEGTVWMQANVRGSKAWTTHN